MREPSHYHTSLDPQCKKYQFCIRRRHGPCSSKIRQENGGPRHPYRFHVSILLFNVHIEICFYNQRRSVDGALLITSGLSLIGCWLELMNFTGFMMDIFTDWTYIKGSVCHIRIRSNELREVWST